MCECVCVFFLFACNATDWYLSWFFKEFLFLCNFALISESHYKRELECVNVDLFFSQHFREKHWERATSAQLSKQTRNDSFFSLGQNCIPAHFSASLSRARARFDEWESKERMCVCVSSRPVCTISFIFAGRPTSKKIVRVRKLLNLCDFFLLFCF